MRGENRRAHSLRERASGADADPPESFLASSSSLRVLNPEKSGRLRQNLARAAERAELDAQRALEAEKLRLQKVKGKGSFSERHKRRAISSIPTCARAPRRARRDGRHLREPRPDRPRDGGVRVDGSERRAGGYEAGGDFDGSGVKAAEDVPGEKGGEALARRLKPRRPRRTYGSADGFANVNVFTQGSGVATNFAENRNPGTGAFGRSERSKPLGSSFF